jgi:putative ABC transport system permease protein
MLLRLISWPYFRKHVLRTLLTTAGVVLGVAVFTAVTTANDSVQLAFTQTIDRLAGATDLQVTAGEAGFDEEVLEIVQDAPSVQVAVPVIEAVVDSGLRGQGSLLVLGVDMTGDRTLRQYDFDEADEEILDDPLVFLAQPDSIILTRTFADRNQLSLNSQIALGTVMGERRFTVRGIMTPSGFSSAFGGNLAIMDIYAAQRMFGRGRTFDRIDVAVAPGTTVAEAQQELSGLLGPGFDVQEPSGRGRQFVAMTAAYSFMVNVSSLFALFIGVFIIYNSFAIAVTQRRSEIGILRALGASRRQVRRLFLAESAVMGIVGSAVGVVFGLAVAGGVTTSIGNLFGNVYGVAQRPDGIAVQPALVAAAVVIGVLTSLLAAFVPAQQAARVDPVQALQKGKFQASSARANRTRTILAAACGVVSLVFATQGDSRIAFYAAYGLFVAAALLATPLLSLVLTRVLRPALRSAWPVEGALAADSLIGAPRRTSASVTGVMLSLALVVGFGGMARASYEAIVEWMNVAFNPDLFVLPSQDIVVRTLRFPADMTAELSSISGVRELQRVRSARITFRQTPVMLVATDIASMGDTSRRRQVAGDPDEMYRLTAAGQGLIVSDNLAQLHGLRVGETLEIAAPHDTIELPVAGTVVDYTEQQGTVFMDLSLFQRYWGDDTISAFRLYLDPDARPEDVKERILERYAGERQVFVLANHELKEYIVRITDQWFGLTWVQVGIAVFVAVLGIANTLTVSITDRRRELGVLRAVGGLHGQIRGTIWIEALGIGALGLALGLVFGAANLYYVLEMVHRDVIGMRFDYAYPTVVALAMVPTILGAAWIAAVWPAESAVHAPLVEALEYE